MNDYYLVLENWPVWGPPLIVFGTTFVIGLAIRFWAFRLLNKLSTRSGNQVDDIVVGALRGPVLIWILMLAIQLAAQSSRLPQRGANLISKILLILWVISLTIVCSRIAAGVVRRYGRQIEGPIQVTSLTENVARLTVIVLGILVLLSGLGIPVTPILTALGVGGLAVALALQDTLSNLFAGIYISLASQVRVGDYVKLDSGEEGYVADITWRSTTIRALANNLIIIPNAKLAQANITNYHLPEKRMSLLIRIGVSYESDPDHIEQVLIEEAKTAATVIPGLLSEPAPFVRFIPGFGDFSLDFTLIVQVSEFVDQYAVQHELRKRLFKRFRSEGIEIPFPIRTLHVKSAAAVAGASGPGHSVEGR
jgi:small-conductance mechanosensitive channel